MISGEVKFLLTHSSIYGLGNVVSQLVAFVLLPLYTRYLTPKDYGVLEAVDISTGIIGIVVTMGIARALSRFYYEKEEGKARKRKGMRREWSQSLESWALGQQVQTGPSRPV